jgi:hypothetical protein
MLALVAGSASAAKVVNGGFETGSLQGWDQTLYPHPEVPSGSWLLYGQIMRGKGAPPAPPPRGDFAAFTDQFEVSGMILSQVVRLKRNRTHKLGFQLAYTNHNTGEDARHGGTAAGFITPPTLAVNVPNQQFRMDVLKPGAPIKSVDGDDVLKRVYRTDRGDSNHRAFRKVTANLTPFAGRKVRLRFAVVVTEDVLNAAIDAVRIRSKPAG